MDRIRNNPLPVIFFTVFVDLVGFGILIPVIPLLLANPKSPYYILSGSTNIAEGYILLGFLTAIFPLMQFLAAPILGQLSDKYGRKKILGISLLGTSLSYILFAIGIITKNIPLLFISRAFDGITGGNAPVFVASLVIIVIGVVFNLLYKPSQKINAYPMGKRVIALGIVSYVWLFHRFLHSFEALLLNHGLRILFSLKLVYKKVAQTAKLEKYRE